MRKSSRISVAMAAYNGESYLSEQIESILRQTFPVAEIVVCDDCSTDNTFPILKRYSERFPSLFRVFRNEKRVGVSCNFERAVSLTTGDIVFLSDQDDVWLPEKVERMTALLEASPGAEGCFSDSLITDADLNPTGVSHWEIRGFSNDTLIAALCGGTLSQLDIFLKRVPASGHDMAFRASAKNSILPFPPLENCHDTWIGLYLVALHQWTFTGETLTLFRRHRSNFSGVGKDDHFLGRFRAARRSIRENTFAWNARLFDMLAERLEGKCDAAVEDLLKDRAAHSGIRSAMDCPLHKRLRLVAGEVRNGRYFRYGRGICSIIQDLLLRKPW